MQAAFGVSGCLIGAAQLAFVDIAGNKFVVAVFVFFGIGTLIGVIQPVAPVQFRNNLRARAVGQSGEDFGLPCNRLTLIHFVVADIGRAVGAGNDVVLHDIALTLVDVARAAAV